MLRAILILDPDAYKKITQSTTSIMFVQRGDALYDARWHFGDTASAY